MVGSVRLPTIRRQLFGLWSARVLPERRIGRTELMAHGPWKSLGFEMKSQVGESVESSALVSAPKTFCAYGHRLDACVCVCVCSFPT